MDRSSSTFVAVDEAFVDPRHFRPSSSVVKEIAVDSTVCDDFRRSVLDPQSLCHTLNQKFRKFKFVYLYFELHMVVALDCQLACYIGHHLKWVVAYAFEIGDLNKNLR